MRDPISGPLGGGPPPRRRHERLRDAAFLSAGLWLPLSGLLAAVVSMDAAIVVAATGVGANAVLALFWSRIPQTLNGSWRATATAWSLFAAWQGGVLFLLFALTSPDWAPTGTTGGFLLVTAALLAVEHFGTAMYRSRATWMPRVRIAAALLGIAAVPLVVAALFLALSFRVEEPRALREWGLQILGLGFLVPGLLAAAFLNAPKRKYAAA